MVKKSYIYKTFVFILILSSINVKQISFSAEDKKIEKKIQLSLKYCIEEALINNLEFQYDQFDPKITKLGIQKIYDENSFIIGFQPSLRQGIKPVSNTSLSGINLLNEISQSYDFFTKKKLFSGGEISFNFENSLFSTNSPRYEINPSITPKIYTSFFQPLLKQGFVFEKKLIIAKNINKISNYKIRKKASDLVLRIQNIYWNIISTQERLKVLENSLVLAKELLNVNIEKQKAGFLAKIDVLTTEANIASKKEGILQVQRDLEIYKYNLKRLINLKYDYNYDIELTDKPVFQDFTFNIKDNYENAINKRFDYQISLIELNIEETNLLLAEKNKLPALNFNGNLGLESLSNDYLKSLGSLFSFQNYFWNLGLSLELPIGDNIAQTNYQENLLTLEQNKKSLEGLKQNIFFDIKQAILDFEINKQRIEANKIAKELAFEQLKAETEKLNLGLSTNFQVLQYQKSYEEAGLNQVNSIIDYIKSIN
ncbi:MAG: TolC family protein, partial [Cyanobacteriota bacterium]